MTGHDCFRQNLFDGGGLQGQIFSQFIGDKFLPVNIIDVSQNGTKARRFDFSKGFKGPGARLRSGLLSYRIFLPASVLNQGLTRGTITKLEIIQITEMINLRPVNDMGFAPQVPAVKRPASP